MKKITIIASLLIVFTACQKADIRPRHTCGEESTPEMQRISESNSDGTTVGTPNALSGSETGTTTVDPNDPENPNGGDITDPLRKKDQKDNK
jgi:hypothetical protein